MFAAFWSVSRSFSPSSENAQDRSFFQMRQKPHHIAHFECNAAGSWLITRSRQVEKYCRAVVATTTGDVPVEDDAYIVEAIIPLQKLVAGFEWHANRPVIGAVPACVAPDGFTRYPLQRKRAGKGMDSLSPDHAVKQSHRGYRRCAVPFPLAGCSSVTANSCGKNNWSETYEGTG